MNKPLTLEDLSQPEQIVYWLGHHDRDAEIEALRKELAEAKARDLVACELVSGLVKQSKAIISKLLACGDEMIERAEIYSAVTESWRELTKGLREESK